MRGKLVSDITLLPRIHGPYKERELSPMSAFKTHPFLVIKKYKELWSIHLKWIESYYIEVFEANFNVK